MECLAHLHVLEEVVPGGIVVSEVESVGVGPLEHPTALYDLHPRLWQEAHLPGRHSHDLPQPLALTLLHLAG